MFLVWSKFSINLKSRSDMHCPLFRIKSWSVGRSGRNSKVEGALIMLQIVMVSPGTHLVKNHESLSITNESWIENAWAFMETDAKTPYCSLLELKYSPSIYLKQKKKIEINMHLYTTATNHMNRIFDQKIFKSIDRSLGPTGRMPWIILRLWGFLCVRNAGRGGKKIS